MHKAENAVVGYCDQMSASTRIVLSAVFGLVAGVAAATFLLMVWVAAWHLTPQRTQERATRLDPSRATSDLLVVSAGVAILAAVALALVRAGSAHGGTKAYLLAVGLLSVVFSWLCVHTVFTLTYARLFYGNGVGGIDFNDDEDPDYLDFAYLAFTIGMTFQVSDTDLTAKAIRRAALRHALVSYLFGAVIVALVINIVASLL